MGADGAGEAGTPVVEELVPLSSPTLEVTPVLAGGGCCSVLESRLAFFSVGTGMTAKKILVPKTWYI